MATGAAHVLPDIPKGTELSDTSQFLEWMFGATPPGRIWIGGHGDEFHGRTFTDIDAAGEYARHLDDQRAGGVYFRLTTLNPIERGRGKASDSSHLVAFAADLDLAGPGHKAAKLPRPDNEEDLRAILAAAGAPEPTAWVHSGGGRYTFWKLDEPRALDVPGAFEWAESASSTLHARIIATAAGMGWKIDNTRDLARIYRLPGTHNLKGEQPFVAKVLSSHGPSYSPNAWSEASTTPSTTEYDGVRRASTTECGEPMESHGSQLFGGDAGPARDIEAPRFFTLTDAMTFVEPALGALRSARDGEINVLLNLAATTLAHFGPEFWDRDAAERELHKALEFTAYDGATWKAQDTINSAYEAMSARGNLSGTGDYWRARFVAETSAEQVAAAAIADDAVERMMAKLLTREQLNEIADPRPLIEDLLDMDSESWVIGASGGFKSFVALDMACHVANGMPWRGHDVTRGEVIYIVAEGAKGIRKRVKAWELTYGRRADGVYVLPEPVQVAGQMGAKGGLSAEWQTLIEVVRRKTPVLVVIDTQARVTVGLNENDNSEMGIFVEAVRRMKQAAGSCVLVVHHTGRNGGDARGASAIDGAQDTEIKVVRPDGAKRDEMTATVVLDKQKDGSDKLKIEIKMTSVEVGQNVWTGKTMTSLAIIPDDGDEKWQSALFKPEPVPAWKLELTDMAAEVMVVMQDHAGEDGATNAQIKTWITERRKERDIKVAVVTSTLSSAIRRLCGEEKSPDGVWTGQELVRLGRGRVGLPGAD